ncbi:hypothetical protein [Lacinutrix salivirga]
MPNKKNIDRLFQEKFKDFEVSPNSKVWSNIQEELAEKHKSKRVIPLWFKYSGIAALLLLFLAIGFISKNAFQTTSPSNNNSIVNSKKEEVNSNTETQKTTDINLELLNNTKTSKNSTITSNATNATEIKNNTTGFTSNIKKNKTSKLTISTNNNYNQNTTNSALNTVSEEDVNYKNATAKTDNKINTKNKNFNTNKTELLNTTTSNSNSNSNNSIANKDNIENNTSKDSTSIDLSIEEAIAKNEEVIEKEKLTNKWSVNANIAPVYYNSLGKGSHIDNQFIDNPKKGEVNTSYGIKVGYALNNKLTVRSGINSLNLSYDTANVLVYDNVASSSNSALKNIDFVSVSPGTTQSFSVLSGNEFAVQQTSSLVGNNLKAALSQRISYIEIPLEVEYKLIDKRFGLHVITGFSSFIANDNEVVSEIAGQKTVIGKANNINDVSFSTNLGIGIDYKFSESFKFNLEPTFKYQLNAYSETSGNFNPYIIGVYTGFSYRF